MPARKNTNKHKQRARVTKASYQALPVVIKAEHIFSKDADQTAPYAAAVIVCSAFPIKDRLKASTAIRWFWSGKAWVSVVRTKKMWDAAFASVAEAAEAEKIAIDDQRTAWVPTNLRMVIDVFEDLKGVLCVALSSHTFAHKDLLKEHGGKFHKATKTWEVNPSVIKPLVPLLVADGVPLFGNFNADNAYTDVLTRAGYKKSTVPEELALDDDAEAWQHM